MARRLAISSPREMRKDSWRTWVSGERGVIERGSETMLGGGAWVSGEREG